MFLSVQLPVSLEYLCIGKEYSALVGSEWIIKVDDDDVLVLKSHFRFDYPALRQVHFYSVSIQLDWMDGKVRETQFHNHRG